MKSKIILLALILFCSANWVNAQADKKPAETIDEGGNATDKDRSIAPLMQAFITDNEFIEVYFKGNIGVVNITVVDNAGMTVYRDVTNPTISNSAVINISDLRSGVYTISYKSVNGKLNKRGVFEKD